MQNNQFTHSLNSSRTAPLPIRHSRPSHPLPIHHSRPSHVQDMTAGGTGDGLCASEAVVVAAMEAAQLDASTSITTASLSAMAAAQQKASVAADGGGDPDEAHDQW